MAIGDAVAVFLGTATTNRQPSSGVEEQITAIGNGGSTDNLDLYDGSNILPIMDVVLETKNVDSTARNMALMINNTIYLRKSGSTDRWYVAGVQTNV
jgi:hypothetical protein|tara:strand:- start:506 stop:796 length:291 start_codon:yes stop_codon:yes gene_type:complete